MKKRYLIIIFILIFFLLVSIFVIIEINEIKERIGILERKTDRIKVPSYPNVFRNIKKEII